MSEISEERLVQILDRLDQGEPMEQILAGYPQQADQVGVVLETVGQLSQLASRPYVATKQASSFAFLAQAADMQAIQQAALRPAGGWRLFRNLAFAMAALLLVLFGASILAGPALPGDFFYGPKRAMESARLSLTNNPEAILDLTAQFQAERLAEVEALLSLGRSGEVEFEGLIEAMAADELVVAGITVLLNEETQVDGRSQIEAVARVLGYTEGGVLFARRVIILSGSPDPEMVEEPPLEPVFTVTPEPVQSTPRPASTPTTAQENPPEATLTAPPSPTVTQAPPALPSPSPSPISTTEGGGSDDGTEEPGDDDGDSSDEPGDDSGSGGEDDPDEPDEEEVETPEPEEETREADDPATAEPESS